MPSSPKEYISPWFTVALQSCNENFGTGPKMERGSKFSLRNLARQGKSFPRGCFKMSDCGAASSDDKRALIEAVHIYFTDGRYPDRCGEPKSNGVSLLHS